MEEDSSRATGPDSGFSKSIGSFRFLCFSLQFVNALGSSYYFNYLFFYLRDHFGFTNRDNLCISALYGFVYCLGAWFAGPFGKKNGYFLALKLGFGGMALSMVIGALAPVLLGFTNLALAIEVLVVIGWTFAMCLTWPTLQYLLSREQNRQQLSRTAGIYNMGWSGAAALAYLTSGALLDFFSGIKGLPVGREILFWFPALLHFGQLAFLPKAEKLARSIPSIAEGRRGSEKTEEEPDSKATPRAKMFLHLAWVANPFAYVAVYGLIPVIPALAENFHLSATMAGFVCSIWFWSRLGAFLWFSLWPGWHYRFGWLLASYLSAVAGFMAMLLAANLWILVAAQAVFGIAIGLIYYSSLFYSMDTGSSSGKKGGFHEAAIGLGIFLGPGTGVAALYVLPNNANVATWAMSGLMVIGLFLFLWVRYGLNPKANKE
jgi:MFS family permease